jgi:uncharacterized delta-60 repeat protein
MLCRIRNQRDTHIAQRLVIRPSARGWRHAGYLLLLAAWTQAFGQVSVLDPSFKVGPGANDAVDSLVVQADGRILVGGEFMSIGGCSNSFLARLGPDGSVDASFNPAGQTDGVVQCLLQQPDRKVLVGGSFGRLLGHTQPALARLLEDGSVDATFDASATFNTNTTIFSLALRDDGRLLVGYLVLSEYASRIVRLNTNGAPDPTFVCTNRIGGYVFALLPQADGGVLFGGNFMGIIGSTNYSLFRLGPDGRLDDTFDAGLNMSSVFCLVRQPRGQILVGGWLNRRSASNSLPLLRLTSDLQWDEGFKIDALGGVGGGGFMDPSISALLLQPDGKIVVGGFFFEVAGYWRRQIVRLTPEGHVDGCFDPGLGLGGTQPDGAVRAMALQPDGRVLIGGMFQGVDTAIGQLNLARLLPKSDCDLVRVYLKGGDQPFAAATFPPGRTNYLEMSADLTNWQPVQTNTSPYIWYPDYPNDTPQAFFRARQER